MAPQKDLAKGWEELKPWLTVKAGAEREQMHVNAVRAMYEGYRTEPGTKRWDDYLALMRQLQSKYPDDINASLLYGLGLTWTAGPGETGLQQRREALSIFLPIFKKYPNNPGVPTTSSMPQTPPSCLRSPASSTQVCSYRSRLSPRASYAFAHLQSTRTMAGLHSHE